MDLRWRNLWMLIVCLGALAGCTWLETCRTPHQVEKPEWAALFEARQTHGCFILFDEASNTFYRCQPARCAERFLPASTFKIPNALIALDTGVLRDADTVIHWDGQKRQMPEWNRDLTLRGAFKYSAVWYFQEVARRIGERRMHETLNRIGYGNDQAGPKVDTFWLDGRLRISAEEQIIFIRRLYHDRLPVSRHAMDVVKDIMLFEQGAAWRWRAKSGTIQREGKTMGWLVGWLERDGQAPAFFAINLEGAELSLPTITAARVEITRTIFKDLGLLE